MGTLIFKFVHWKEQNLGGRKGYRLLGTEFQMPTAWLSTGWNQVLPPIALNGPQDERPTYLAFSTDIANASVNVTTIVSPR